MFYRLIAAFEPGHPRLTGSRSTNSKRGQEETIRRGVWRVVDCYIPAPGVVAIKVPLIAAHDNLFCVSPRRLKVGTLCNPHKLLNEVLAGWKGTK
jgi:hypothetical protein